MENITLVVIGLLSMIMSIANVRYILYRFIMIYISTVIVLIGTNDQHVQSHGPKIWFMPDFVAFVGAISILIR